MTNANGVVVSNNYGLINRLTSRVKAWRWKSIIRLRRQRFDRLYESGQSMDPLCPGRSQSPHRPNQRRADQSYSATTAWMISSGLTDGLDHNPATWGYNQYGWLTSKTNNLSANIITYTYDADGRVINRWMMGTNTGYKFDAVGNLTNINYPTTTVTFGYDAINELTSLIDQVGTTTFTWTPTSQLATETSPWASSTLSYAYSQGPRTNLSLAQPSGAWSPGPTATIWLGA